MIRRFTLDIHPVTSTAIVRMDGSRIDARSPLQLCSVQPLCEWIALLPQRLYQEANGSYSLSVLGTEFECLWVELVLKNNPHCANLHKTIVKSAYTMEQRMMWAKELINLNRSVSITPPESFRLTTVGRLSKTGTQILEKLALRCPNLSSSKTGRWNIVLADSYAAAQKLCPKPSVFDLYVILSNGTSQFRASKSQGLVLEMNPGDISWLAAWVQTVICAPWISRVVSAFKNMSSSAPFSQRARLALLTGEVPVVDLSINPRMEVGQSQTVGANIFPPGSRMMITSTNSALVQVNGMSVRALKPGTCMIQAVNGWFRVLGARQLTVYFVNRAQSVTLTTPMTQLIESERFSVTPHWQPANAVNTAHAVWSCSSSLRSLGQGNFMALTPGAAWVRLSLSPGIDQKLNLRVVPKPNSVDLAPVYKVRLRHAPLPVSLKLQPAGSLCRHLSVTTADSSIARWDDKAKTLVPVREGTTKLIVRALDSSANVLHYQSADVEVLPPKDIITADTVLTLILICDFLMIITRDFWISELIAFGLIALIGDEIYQALKQMKTQSGKTAAIYKLVIAAASIIAVIARLSHS